MIHAYVPGFQMAYDDFTLEVKDGFGRTRMQMSRADMTHDDQGRFMLLMPNVQVGTYYGVLTARASDDDFPGGHRNTKVQALICVVGTDGGARPSPGMNTYRCDEAYVRFERVYGPPIPATDGLRELVREMVADAMHDTAPVAGLETGSVTSEHIKDGTIGMEDLSPEAREAMENQFATEDDVCHLLGLPDN